MNQMTDRDNPFDIRIARETAQAFAHSTAISCALVNREGAEFFRCDPQGDPCAQCRRVMGDQNCEALHRKGAVEAERFGGRYIYFCPMGMGCFASPVIFDGKQAGALIAGPVLIMDWEDLVACTPALQKLSSEKMLETMSSLSGKFPRREPSDLNHLSAMLLSSALYIGGERHELMERRRAQEQYQDIGEYIHQLKLVGVSGTYPLDKEQTMMRAIREGDLNEARAALNELLGHIFFASGGDFSTMRARSVELMSLLSRAAAEGGADLDYVLELNKRFLKESIYLRSVDELTVWLTQVIERYAAMVFDLIDVKHKDVIYKAINYMKRHYNGKVTLEDTARHVGFTPTYFSKVFKEEVGVTFNSYLGNLRVERSKALLLAGELSIGEICAAAGFEDQSYFIKVFRKYTGVTPGQFRKQQGRLDSKKERGIVER